MTAVTTQRDAAALQAEIDQREAALAPVFAERDRLNEHIVAEREAIEALKSQRDALRIAQMGDTTDWGFLLDSDSSEAYKERCRRLEQAGFHGSGTWVDSGQAAIKFMLLKGRAGEVERACAFVRQVLPFARPLKDGLKHFGVFESTLSEHGSYTVRIDEAAASYALHIRRYSRDSEVFRAGTLEELVQYLHDKHYYEIFGNQSWHQAADSGAPQ